MTTSLPLHTSPRRSASFSADRIISLISASVKQFFQLFFIFFFFLVFCVFHVFPEYLKYTKTPALYLIMIPSSKGHAFHACMIRLLNLGPAKHEKAAIYIVNQRISNVCRIAGAASHFMLSQSVSRPVYCSPCCSKIALAKTRSSGVVILILL